LLVSTLLVKFVPEGKELPLLYLVEGKVFEECFNIWLGSLFGF